MDSQPAGSAFDYSLAPFITFRDQDACRRAREIPRERLTDHPNPEFKIRIIDEPGDFYHAFAADLVGRIREARDAGRRFVALLPVGPMPQYEIAAAMINAEGLSLHHVDTFNLDEYADENGVTAPASWAGSFQRAMLDTFFGRIDAGLRPPESQIHFPTTDKIEGYADEIAQAGGADICYGGIGWSGHIAFWEPHLGLEWEGDLDGYKQAGPRLVDLHPMTVMQNALHSFAGDWSLVPPKANTIGPSQILGARHRSFWLDGDAGGGLSWQRFIARLVAHGPVSELVPGSLLQETRADYTILGGVAENISVSMA